MLVTQLGVNELPTYLRAVTDRTYTEFHSTISRYTLLSLQPQRPGLEARTKADHRQPAVFLHPSRLRTSSEGGPWRGGLRPCRFLCPVFQPCHAPAHPIWKWGAGFKPHTEEVVPCVNTRSAVPDRRHVSHAAFPSPPPTACPPRTRRRPMDNPRQHTRYGLTAEYRNADIHLNSRVLCETLSSSPRQGSQHSSSTQL